MHLAGPKTCHMDLAPRVQSDFELYCHQRQRMRPDQAQEAKHWRSALCFSLSPACSRNCYDNICDSRSISDGLLSGNTVLNLEPR